MRLMSGKSSSRLEADLAKLALDGVGMEGGAAGVQLLESREHLDETLKLLAAE